MTMKSGWCVDAETYAFLDNPAYARQLHASCRRPHICTCTCHAPAPESRKP